MIMCEWLGIPIFLRTNLDFELMLLISVVKRNTLAKHIFLI